MSEGPLQGKWEPIMELPGRGPPAGARALCPDGGGEYATVVYHYARWADLPDVALACNTSNPHPALSGDQPSTQREPLLSLPLSVSCRKGSMRALRLLCLLN